MGFRRWAWKLTASAVSLLALLAPIRSQAQNINITYSELKFGVWDHDSKLLSGREKGIDLNPEVIFGPPIDDDMVADVPPWLHWLTQPRPTIGAAFNTDGLTDQYYLGGTWSWFLVRDLINPDDGIVFSFFFGPGFNDGQLHNGNAQRKALGSHVLFREATELGYQINATWQISGYLDHISNGGFAKENQSVNDLGIRLGYRF
jgi:lipid A 3-O-deacylase